MTREAPTFEQGLRKIHYDHITYRLGDVEWRAATQARTLVWALDGHDWSVLAGKRVIDIGCGCDGRYKDGIRPALAPFLGIHGAISHGIDQYPYTGPMKELYVHHIHNLLDNPFNLRRITGLSAADIVHCNAVVDPSSWGSTSPNLQRQVPFNRKNMQAVERRIRIAAFDILVPGGIFVYNYRVFKKQ